MSAKLITVRFTAQELNELDNLLANGVCEYSLPENATAASAYDKITKASRARPRAALSQGDAEHG